MIPACFALTPNPPTPGHHNARFPSPLIMMLTIQ